MAKLKLNNTSKYKKGTQAVRYEYGVQEMQVPPAGGMGNVLSNVAGGASLGANFGPYGALAGGALGLGKGLIENRNITNSIQRIEEHNRSIKDIREEDSEFQTLQAKHGMVVTDAINKTNYITPRYGRENSIQITDKANKKYNFGTSAISAIPQAMDFFGIDPAISQPISSLAQTGGDLIQENQDKMSQILSMMGGLPVAEEGRYSIAHRGAKHIEAEGEEIVMKRGKNGKYHMKKSLKGPTHAEGGIDMIVETGDVIFPKKMKKKVLEAYKNNDNLKLESLRSRLPKDTDVAQDGLDNDFEKYFIDLNDERSGIGASQWRGNLKDRGLEGAYDEYLKTNQPNLTEGTNMSERLSPTKVLNLRKGFMESQQVPLVPKRTSFELDSQLPNLEIPSGTGNNLDPINTPNLNVPSENIVRDNVGGNDVEYSQDPNSRFKLPNTEFDANKFRMNAPSAYNIGQGLFGNVENPARRFLDSKELQYQDLSAEDRAAASRRDATARNQISGAYMSRGQEQSSLAQNRQRYANEIGRVNQQEARRFSDIDRFNVQQQNRDLGLNLGLANQYDNIFSQNKGTKQRFLAKGIGQQSELGAYDRQEGFMRDKVAELNSMDNIKMRLELKKMFGNDQDAINQFMQSTGLRFK